MTFSFPLLTFWPACDKLTPNLVKPIMSQHSTRYYAAFYYGILDQAADGGA